MAFMTEISKKSAVKTFSPIIIHHICIVFGKSYSQTTLKMLKFKKQTPVQVLLGFLTVLVLQVSCKNDIDINADWKETMVIYGILEPGLEQQKIRVSKAFQNGKTSALVAAQISDSLFLDTVNVTLTNLKTGIEYKLVPQFNEPKEPGIFANDKNPIYVLDSAIHGHVIDPDVDYKIEVVNPKTGSTAFSKTRSMGFANLAAPVIADNSIFNIGQNFSFAINPGRNAYSYDGKMDITIKEWNTITKDTTEQVIRWNYLTDFIVNQGSSAAITRIPRISFLQLLSSVYKKNKDLHRRIERLDFVTFGGNQQLYDFISVNEPAIGIVQKQTEYSNIVNGYGLFASRTEQWFYNCVPHNGLIGVIRSDSETKDLNFEF